MLSVNDLMTVDPITTEPDTPVRAVYEMMLSEGCRQIPVVDESGQLIGIVTERDVREIMNSHLFDIATVDVIMSENPITTTPDTPAYRAAEMLRSYKVGSLPVVDNGALVGIITVSDFLEHFSQSHRPHMPRPKPLGD